ncbi:MAG: phosphatase PAP2 family protein [Paraclostridium sp.]
MDIQVEILKYIQSFKSPILNLIFLVITISTEVPVILVVASILYWCINKKYGQKLLFALTTNIAINTGIKEFFKSPRPIGIAGIESMRTETATGYSFPSGHTQTGTTFWVSIMSILKNKYVYIIGTILFLGIGLSRLYLGVHWPIDVIFGWIFGLTFTISCNFILDKVEDKNNYKYFLYLLIPMTIWIFIVNSVEYVKMFGLFTGFIVGYIIEKRYVKFDVNVSIKSKICRYIFGLTTLGLVYIGLKLIMPVNVIGAYIRYFGLVVYAIAIAPLLFNKFWKE